MIAYFIISVSESQIIIIIICFGFVLKMTTSRYLCVANRLLNQHNLIVRKPIRARFISRRQLSVGSSVCVNKQLFDEAQRDLPGSDNGKLLAKGGLTADGKPTTNKLCFLEPKNVETIKQYRILNEAGELIGELDASLSSEKIIELYQSMLMLNEIDKVMFNCHRQGRISFYMTSFGEEAAQVGTAAGLEARDLIFAQYREAGILIHRKMPLNLMLAQCFGNGEDLGRGRQMPVHYGSRELNYVTISSPLATQLPQAVGAARVFKGDRSGRIVACYFGEGAASEGDAHAAMNMAATLDCPVLFVCRNNGYAISTPVGEQYRGDGVAARALGYGMSAIRVDGNDLFATYAATRAASQLSREQSRPVLLEAMTYRVGHHSTSDDSLAYRAKQEVEGYEKEQYPIGRVYKYLVREQLWTNEMELAYRADVRKRVIDALNVAEKVKKSPVTSMFDDVYAEMPDNLQNQRKELEEHLVKFGSHYSLEEYEGI